MIIYKVTNLVNQKIYIGQSINSLEHRRSEHYKDSKRTDRPTVYFHKALLKYGYANFKWEVIEELDSLDLLNEREIYWISFYNSIAPNGYNMINGGNKFKDDNQKLFYSDSEKQFFDPLQFFDFDEQFNYNMSNHDYH